jgi:hypothetical protein
MAPFQTGNYSMKKKGALVTALFEGYLIQIILRSGVLNKDDLKRGIQQLINL